MAFGGFFILSLCLFCSTILPTTQGLRLTFDNGLKTGDLIEWSGKISHLRTQTFLFFRNATGFAVIKLFLQGHRNRIKISNVNNVVDKYACLGPGHVFPEAAFQALIQVNPTSLIVYWNNEKKFILPFPNDQNSPGHITQAALYGRDVQSLTFHFRLVQDDILSHNFVSDVCGRTIVGDSTDVMRICEPSQNPFRIAGGYPAIPKQHPWQGAIRFKPSLVSNVDQRHHCGAILIGNSWALTAAHCFKSVDPNSLERFIIRFGDYYNQDDSPHSSLTRLENSVDVNISRVIKHHSYSSRSQPINDIALIKLSQPVTFNDFVYPACLPSTSDQFRDGYAECGVTGWGATAFGENVRDYPKCLLAASVTIRNVSQCRENYIDHIFNNETMFCASNPSVDTCQGDSGGPLICTERVGGVDRHILWGITSWGVGCAQANKPGIYTRVSHFKKWIYLHTQRIGNYNHETVQLLREQQCIEELS